MSVDAADLAGFAGSALMVAGYAYSNVAARMNLTLFNALNLAGSALLIASLAVHFNLPAMVLEVVWGAIAALGLARALVRAAAR